MGCLCLREPGRLQGPSPQEFMKAFVTVLDSYGVRRPGIHNAVETGLGATLQETKDIIDSHMEQLMRAKCDFLVIILPSRDAAVYSHIKYCGDVKLGIDTLCICPKPPKGEKIDRLDTSPGYLANLCLKYNLKRGGVNHELTNCRMPDNTIYIGIDVTHPTGIESQKDAPSIAGVVANTDSSLGQWPASIRRQQSRQEMVAELKDMIIERLKSWKQMQHPAHVLIYRDGVSESQYQAVLKEELPQIKEATKTYYAQKGWPRPKITIVIVGKRHHTR